MQQTGAQMKNEKIRIGSDYSGVGAYNHNLKRCGIDYEEVFACDFNLYARISFLSTFGTEDDLKLAKSKDHKQFAAEVERICLGESLLDGDTQKLVLYFANEFAKKFSFYYPFNVYDREIPSESLDEYMTSPPCQAFSLAGKREGKESLKGILFFNSHEFIDKNRPRFFRFENVKGLLSDDGGRTFQEWINMLGGKSVNGVPVLFPDENSVPYHIYWRVLNAKDYNIPQNRERVFIVGIRDDVDNVFQWPREMFLDKKLKDVLEHEVDLKYFLSDFAMDRLKRRNYSSAKINPEIAGTINTKNNSPQCCFDSGTTLLTHGFGTKVLDQNEDGSGQPVIRIKSATKSGFEIASENDSINFSQSNSKTRRVRVGKEIAQTLDTSCNQAVICIPVLTPDRVEKRQNGRRFKEDGDPSFTITTQDRHGIYDGYSIRRLTPLECWRLMDFPDQAIQNAINAGMSDSQLYKQAGNSIPVGVLVGITKGLKRLVNKHENI